AEVQVLLRVEMTARDRGLHAAAVHDGKPAVGPDVAQAGGGGVQAEAGGRTVGQGERQRGVLAAHRYPDVRPCLLVMVAVVAGDGHHEVEPVDAAAQEHVDDGVVAVGRGVRLAGEEHGGGGGADRGGGAAALQEAAAI